MGIWETRLWRENTALGAGDSGDLAPSVRLPEDRAISRMALTVRCTNGATSNTDNAGALETIVNSISEITVKTGSRVFQEFSGQACRDWAIYETGRNPFFFNTQVGAGVQEAVFPINFGRPGIPYDTVCGLPTPLYAQKGTNLSLKYDFTIDGADGFATGTHKFDLAIEMMPQLDVATLQNMRVLEKRKKLDITTAASGVKPYDLTIDPQKQLKNLMISCYETGIAEGVDISKVALFVDSAEVCVDDWSRWQNKNAEDCGLKFEQIIDSVYLDGTSHVLRTEIPNVEPFHTEQDTGIDAYITCAGDAATIASAASAGENVMLSMRSKVIPRCVFLDFDKDLSLRNMISQDARDIVLKLTHGGADGTVEVHECSVMPA